MFFLLCLINLDSLLSRPCLRTFHPSPTGDGRESWVPALACGTLLFLANSFLCRVSLVSGKEINKLEMSAHVLCFPVRFNYLIPLRQPNVDLCEKLSQRCSCQERCLCIRCGVCGVLCNRSPDYCVLKWLKCIFWVFLGSYFFAALPSCRVNSFKKKKRSHWMKGKVEKHINSVLHQSPAGCLQVINPRKDTANHAPAILFMLLR